MSALSLRDSPSDLARAHTTCRVYTHTHVHVRRAYVAYRSSGGSFVAGARGAFGRSARLRALSLPLAPSEYPLDARADTQCVYSLGARARRGRKKPRRRRKKKKKKLCERRKERAADRSGGRALAPLDPPPSLALSHARTERGSFIVTIQRRARRKGARERE